MCRPRSDYLSWRLLMRVVLIVPAVFITATGLVFAFLVLVSVLSFLNHLINSFNYRLGKIHLPSYRYAIEDVIFCHSNIFLRMANSVALTRSL